MDSNLAWQLKVSAPAHDRLLSNPWRALWVLSTVGLGLSAILAAASSIPQLPPIPEAALLVGVGLPVVWLGTLAWLLPRRQRTGLAFGSIWTPAFTVLSGRWRLAIGLGIVLFALTFLSAVPEVFAGNPEIQGDRYVLNSHGETTYVTQSAYDSSIRAHDRFGASVIGWFYLVGVGVMTVAKRRRDS